MKVIKWMLYNLSDLYSNETILTLMHCAHPFDRENMNEPKRSDILLDAIVTFGVGFILGADWFVYALRVAVVKRLFFWV